MNDSLEQLVAQPQTRKKRILFVDDESSMLLLYELAFKHMRDQWEILFASNGPGAMALMEKNPCELIISDMVMPGMSGAQLFSQLMERYPQTTRIILSGQVNRCEVAKCAGAVHQYLLKPCDFPTLKAILQRVCALDVFIRNDRLKSLVGQMGVLPSLPSLYFQMLQELESPLASIEHIAELVARDQGMTAKLLQLVNSASFGIRHKISHPAEVVQFLGVGMIRSLALSIHAFSCFEQVKMAEFSFHRLWEHSLMTALFAKRMIELEDVDKTMLDDVFVAGLLHDIGKLMMVCNLTEEYRQAIALAHEKRIPACEAEEQVLGASHADIGAYLLGLWGLPVAIVEAMALHHTPCRSPTRTFCPLTAVHVANVLENESSGHGEGTLSAGLDEDYLARLNLRDRIEDWRVTVAQMRQQRVC